ncbi:MAG: histidine--tRNA ligase [Clostridiales bacterium]|nr:histidine--tRNA ligase [Clostridiales bacterium]
MINVPKGTKDMLPAEAYKWQFVENAAKKITALYNVKQIRTPVFEHAELFLRSIGDSTDIVNKEMYIFEDKGGRKMALRPEGTAGVVRSVLENNICETLPQKLFYIEGVYRYEQPQAGRYREHHQFGAEFFGSDLPCFEVELLGMARDFLQEIGFNDLRLQINSIGCEKCRAEFNKALREFLASVNDKICSDCRRRAEVNPLRTLDCKVPSCREVYKKAPKISDFLCDECKAHHAEVLRGLDAIGVKYVENQNLVRGLDYYTRTVFEFCDGDLAVLAGGRYDNLCEELGGKHIPCVGFGCGIERLIAAAETRGIDFNQTKPCVFVASQCDAARAECVSIANAMRAGGISAEYDLMGKSLKAQFKTADRQGFSYVLTIGESELQSGVYNLKRMDDGTAVQVSRATVVADIKKAVAK